MAFSSTVLERYITGKGMLREIHSWNGAGVTTGTITPSSTDPEGIGKIVQIDTQSVTDNTTAVRAEYTTGRAGVELTFTSGDTGNLTIEGKAR